MFSAQGRQEPRLCSDRRYFTALLSILLITGSLNAGNGTFRNGRYRFCVSVRFNATGDELDRIRLAFRNANRVFADAIDGKQQIGNIRILNNSTSPSADFWVHRSVCEFMGNRICVVGHTARCVHREHYTNVTGGVLNGWIRN